MNYLRQFKKYFIPHKHNGYKPHFFRVKAVCAMAVLIAFFFVVALAMQSLMIQSGSSQIGAVISSVLVELTNTDRKDNSLHELTVNPLLEKAAQMKADDMAAKGYFAHESPDGVTPWHWFNEAGYAFSFAGENLAVYFSDSAELEQAWMNSPAHRANILNGYFTEIGIGMAKGVYQGKETVFVVQEFGRPSRRAAAAVSQENKTPVVATISTSTTAKKVAVQENPRVKGAVIETQQPEPKSAEGKTDMFIAVQSDEEGVNTPLMLTQQDALTAGTSPAQNPPLLLKVAASPQTSLKFVYVFLAGIITIALALMVGIEIKRQHPVHILYGVLLIFFMGALLYAGQSFLLGKLIIV